MCFQLLAIQRFTAAVLKLVELCGSWRLLVATKLSTVSSRPISRSQIQVRADPDEIAAQRAPKLATLNSVAIIRAFEIDDFKLLNRQT